VNLKTHNRRLHTAQTAREGVITIIRSGRVHDPYRHALMERSYDTIQMVTIRHMLEHGTRLDRPLTREVVRRAASQDRAKQLEL
jgi:hypothetical protein